MLFFKKKEKTPEPEKAAQRPLLPAPIDTSGYKYTAPTDKQLSYARDLGLTLPVNLSRDDVSCLIDRVLNMRDGGTDEPASTELLRFVQALGGKPSPYSDINRALGSVIRGGEKKVLSNISIYLYAVSCDLIGRSFDRGDPEKVKTYLPLAEKFREDPRALKSLNERPIIEYYKPRKGVICYQKAAELLMNKGA